MKIINFFNNKIRYLVNRVYITFKLTLIYKKLLIALINNINSFKLL